MNTIGTSVTSDVSGSVKRSWEPGQTNEWKKEDEKSVITTCSAKTVKWSNVSKSSMAARRPNGQNPYSTIEAFVRDQRRLLPILLQVSVNHAILVQLARSEIRPRIVENLSDEELIQRISSAVRDASRAMQVVPGEIPIVARAGSGEDSGISSIGMHQAAGNYAVELESGSVGTFSTVTGALSALDDDVIAAQQLFVAETVSTSSSGLQNSQANSSRGESHARSQQQPPQNEDQADGTDDERKQPAQKKPRIDE